MDDSLPMNARSTFTFLRILFLTVYAISGCNPSSTSTPVKEPTETPSVVAIVEEPMETPTIVAITGGPTETPTTVAIVEKPPNTPTATAITEEPTETPTPLVIAVDPTTAPTERPTEVRNEGISPAYNIYVGLTLTGICGPYTNSGGFSSFSFDSVFHNVRFQAPSTEAMGLPIGGFYQRGGMIPLLTIRGEGEVDVYAFCPAYDGDKEVTCGISDGPKPFEPSLGIAPDTDALPLEPLVPDASDLDRGPALILSFSIGSATGGGPVMVWDCDDFHRGALGGALQPMSTYFYLPWRRLMHGEDYAVEYPYEEEGERGTWTLRLVPAGDG